MRDIESELTEKNSTTSGEETLSKRYEGFLKNIIVGATEVSKITGVDTRKLRYWQDKGIIKTQPTEGATSQYDLMTIKKIILIQELVEDGYTLDGAAKKIEKRMAKINDVLELIGLSA